MASLPVLFKEKNHSGVLYSRLLTLLSVGNLRALRVYLIRKYYNF